jgi:hypothetical protein
MPRITAGGRSRADVPFPGAPSSPLRIEKAIRLERNSHTKTYVTTTKTDRTKRRYRVSDSEAVIPADRHW